MAELRHSQPMATRAASSPVKRDEPSVSPLFSNEMAGSPSFSRTRDRNRDNKESHRSFLLYLPYSIRSFLSLDDPRVNSLISAHRVQLAFFALLLLVGLVALSFIRARLNAPYLCVKERITLQCPKVREAPSLWENPHSSTTSWKPCAERSEKPISDIPPENGTNGYIFIHAEGGLNQQRIAICNAVAVAKIMNATLILPVLKQDQIWKDEVSLYDEDNVIVI